MLTHPTLDLLHGLGLHDMAQGYKTLETNPEARSLEHAEWLGIILEHEKTLREQKRFESRARAPSAGFSIKLRLRSLKPAPPTFAIRRASRMSTIVRTAASIVLCSSSLPPATGSGPAVIW